MNKKREIMDNENDMVMYILVNNDLPMNKGKIASQVAHSACDVVRYLAVNPTQMFKDWIRYSHAKVVLKSNLEEMKIIISEYSDRTKDLWCAYTIDEGRTQIEKNSLTTLAFSPIRKKDAPYFIKKLKLL